MVDSPINITLTSPNYPKFSWSDDLKSLGDGEIEEFTIILRGALSAFSAELADRFKPRKDQEFEHLKNLLQEAAQQINEQGLNATHERYLESLSPLLIQTEDNKVFLKTDAHQMREKSMRQYFRIVSKVVDRPYVLLIICALGKHRIMFLREYHRIKLVKYIAQNQETLFCRRLQDLPDQSKIPSKGIDFD